QLALAFIRPGVYTLMSQVSDLPLELQRELVFRGFQSSDEITPMGAFAPVEDRYDDGRRTLQIHGQHRSLFVRVDGDGSVRFFSQPNFQNPYKIFIPQFSSWLEKGWPEGLVKAENKGRDLGYKGFVQAMGAHLDPDDVSMASEMFFLPIRHPAKHFLERVSVNFKSEVDQAEKIQDVEERKKVLGPIYEKHREFFRGMKSVGTYYDAGFRMAENFPHFLKKSVKFLYSASGYNVAALATGMALLDWGAPSVDFVFTEMDADSPHAANRVLKAWIKDNPDILAFSSKWEGEESRNGGRRMKVMLTYKGKPITLHFAIGDSPDGLYFDPRDAQESDVAIVHDAYSDVGYTDALLLKQLLPSFWTDHPSHDSPKAILITNELDSDRWDQEGGLESILPTRGIVIGGEFGHGDCYPIRNDVLDGWCMPEVGRSHHKSAVIVSTGHPLLKDLPSEEVELFVDFAQKAGGESEVKRVFGGIPMYAGKRMNDDVKSLLAWASHKLDQLGDDDRYYLALVAARLVVRYFVDTTLNTARENNRFLRFIPKPLQAAMVQALAKEGLIPKPRFSIFTQWADPKKHGERKEFLEKLDKVLKKRQGIKTEG
ncbi:MAG TPA: hypothetical protein DDW49_09965, partial [Deltaproteobacteria bacterium]|nr:hypothetical protein [Deltaproteobacteria bacterium]